MAAVVLLTTISGFLLGYDLCVISSALDYIAKDFNLDEQSPERSLIVSIVSVGALSGSLVGGVISDRCGRRAALFASSTLFAVGSLLISIATAVWEVIVGRVLVGMGLGVGGVVAPVYLTEMATAATRGRLVTLNEIMTCVGCLVATVVNTLISHAEPEDSGMGIHGWRYMMAVCSVPAFLQLIALAIHIPDSNSPDGGPTGCCEGMTSLIPETPRFLAAHGGGEGAPEGRHAALRILRAMRPNSTQEEVQLEYEAILRHAASNGAQELAFIDLLNTYRAPLLVASGLAVCQNLTAANTVLYFGTDILQLAGISDPESGTILLGVAKLLGVVFCLGFVDRWGRKPLLLWGTAGQATLQLVSDPHANWCPNLVRCWADHLSCSAWNLLPPSV